jgi:hypothetical protein
LNHARQIASKIQPYWDLDFITKAHMISGTRAWENSAWEDSVRVHVILVSQNGEQWEGLLVGIRHGVARLIARGLRNSIELRREGDLWISWTDRNSTWLA